MSAGSIIGQPGAGGSAAPPGAGAAADTGARPRAAGVPAPRRAGAQARPARRTASAGPATVRELCADLAPVCRSAVDSLEIASALEFEGLGDQAARDRYGFRDVFALAQEMYFRVPRDPDEPGPAPDPWQVSRLTPALHGLLYGIPAVCFPAAVGLLAGPGTVPALIGALLTAWSLAQGLAYLGYRRLGQAGVDAARRVLLTGMAAALGLMAVVMAAFGAVVHATVPVLLFGVGEGAYMLGACVLLVLGAERWLLAALAPGAAGSAVYLALHRPSGLEHAAWAALACTPLLALVLAVVCKPQVTGPPGAAAEAGRIRLADLRGALPAAGFGLVAAGLLAYPVAAGPHGHGGVNPGALLATLPLSLSMGAAEWSLLWFRRRAQRLLRRYDQLRVFALHARLTLLGATAQYAAGAAVLTAAAAMVAARTGLLHLQASYLPQIAAYLLLGTAMFLALTVQALGLRAVPLAACTAALAAEIVFRRSGVTVQLLACGGLLAVVGGYALAELGKAVRHGI